MKLKNYLHSLNESILFADTYVKILFHRVLFESDILGVFRRAKILNTINLCLLFKAKYVCLDNSSVKLIKCVCYSLNSLSCLAVPFVLLQTE